MVPDETLGEQSVKATRKPLPFYDVTRIREPAYRLASNPTMRPTY